MREIRVSPDGLEVAIRSHADATGFFAWGVLSMVAAGARVKGARWSDDVGVADWTVMASVAPEPELVVEPEVAATTKTKSGKV